MTEVDIDLRNAQGSPIDTSEVEENVEVISQHISEHEKEKIFPK